jgi:hypothetical protein
MAEGRPSACRNRRRSIYTTVAKALFTACPGAVNDVSDADCRVEVAADSGDRHRARSSAGS